ncbi:hypothetical protein GOP47_0018784 [Adiantum capillus-veneris]|uniref:Sulfotransferase n=1 Tax=Adiantum capillus-veneris TaxID=13818 RepID=A0A9D4Z9Z0_ADICA|nr:hypothetical protein GOP47_0018784 [Adiantum capillus-veneris]
MQRVESVLSKLHCYAGSFDGKPSCKEASPKWLYRKANWTWKLILLVALGLSGMYICILGVEKRVMYQKAILSMASGNKVGTTRPCSELNLVDGLFLHHPQPRTFDRKECSCLPVHNFVIFSMQRSGSGWFETLLNSHPNISSHGEVFSVDGRRESASTITRTLDTLYNLDWISSASKNECTAAVGLKWMLNQGVMEYKKEIADYLKDNSVSVIFLFRKNILRRYVSILANSFDRVAKQLNGTHLAHVHSKEEAEVLEAYKPVVNLTSLIPYLERVEEIIDDACSSFKETRHMIFFYEDLVVNPRKELRKAQKFLGVNPLKLESKHVKIHTRPLHGQIENWDDLNEYLKGTRYEIFLKGKDYG